MFFLFYISSMWNDWLEDLVMTSAHDIFLKCVKVFIWNFKRSLVHRLSLSEPFFPPSRVKLLGFRHGLHPSHRLLWDEWALEWGLRAVAESSPSRAGKIKVVPKAKTDLMLSSSFSSSRFIEDTPESPLCRCWLVVSSSRDLLSYFDVGQLHGSVDAVVLG